jgi:hypothetical protein
MTTHAKDALRELMNQWPKLTEQQRYDRVTAAWYSLSESPTEYAVFVNGEEDVSYSDSGTATRRARLLRSERPGARVTIQRVA